MFLRWSLQREPRIIKILSALDRNVEVVTQKTLRFPTARIDAGLGLVWCLENRQQWFLIESLEKEMKREIFLLPFFPINQWKLSGKTRLEGRKSR